MHRESEFLHAERFHEDFLDANSLQVFGAEFACETAGEDDGNIWAEAKDAAGEIDAEHARHGHVCDDEIELFGVVCKSVEGFRWVGERSDFVAEIVEHQMGDITEGQFVIDEHDALA